MARYPFILDDPSYGTERSFNALRLVRSLLDTGEAEGRVFLLGDAAACALGGQKVPARYYNIADMLGAVMRRRGEVAVCGSCMDARGIDEQAQVSGASRGSLEQLTDWTAWADKVLVF